MRTASLRERSEIGFNVTPMIDVTFLLIIFFLISSHLAQQEVQMELDLPAAETGTGANEESRRVVVNVLPEGTTMTAGKLVDLDELERIFRFERRQVGEDLEIRIRSDRQVPFRAVEPIMIAAARAGIWRVTFAVVRRDRGI